MSICKHCDAIGYHYTWCTRPVEAAPAVNECALAPLTEEDKQHLLQRKADQADIIDWILHYKNPADDEAKLRQIRLVME